MTSSLQSRCWAEVDRAALRHNVTALRRRSGSARLMAVVKADAYGHGLAEVAGTLQRCGVDAFAIANPTEAIALRQIVGPAPLILLFGAAFPFEIAALLSHNITPTITTLAMRSGSGILERTNCRRLPAPDLFSFAMKN